MAWNCKTNSWKYFIFAVNICNDFLRFKIKYSHKSGNSEGFIYLNDGKWNSFVVVVFLSSVHN